MIYYSLHYFSKYTKKVVELFLNKKILSNEHDHQEENESSYQSLVDVFSG